MSVELEMMNEENGRLQTIKTRLGTQSELQHTNWLHQKQHHPQ
jgi:hypothetical protein